MCYISFLWKKIALSQITHPCRLRSITTENEQAIQKLIINTSIKSLLEIIKNKHKVAILYSVSISEGISAFLVTLCANYYFNKGYCECKGAPTQIGSYLENVNLFCFSTNNKNSLILGELFDFKILGYSDFNK